MNNGLKIIWCKNCSSVIKFEQTNNEKNEDTYDICISCQSKKLENTKKGEEDK